MFTRTYAEIAAAAGVTPAAVGNWVARGGIPAGRREAVEPFLRGDLQGGRLESYAVLATLHKHGVRFTELARLVGVSQQSVSNWFCARYIPRIRQEAVAGFLRLLEEEGLSMDEVMLPQRKRKRLIQEKAKLSPLDSPRLEEIERELQELQELQD